MAEKHGIFGGTTMKSYTVIPHTADVRLKLSGDTLEEIFLAGLEGMAQIEKKDFCQISKVFPVKRTINLTSLDPTSLLIDFLSYVLTFSHEDQAIFCASDFQILSPTYLNTTVFGAKTDHFDEDIKAVTYHEAEVKKKNGKYETTIIFDI